MFDWCIVLTLWYPPYARILKQNSVLKALTDFAHDVVSAFGIRLCMYFKCPQNFFPSF